MQSLISTCRLHGIDPCIYLVDVLQRVSIHPARQVAELTPQVVERAFRRQSFTVEFPRLGLKAAVRN